MFEIKDQVEFQRKKQKGKYAKILIIPNFNINKGKITQVPLNKTMRLDHHVDRFQHVNVLSMIHNVAYHGNLHNCVAFEFCHLFR